MDKAVIIANRRSDSDYWEGYAERNASETDEWVDYFRSIGSVVKVFPSINEYRADCNKFLDKWEAKEKMKRQYSPIK